MNNKKRITLITLVCLLAAALMIGGTLAWLTDTDAKDNLIKIATIGTTPEEPNWPGDPEDPVTVYPGIPQAKDPTIKLDEGSEPVYVRAIVKVSKDMYDALQAGTGVDFKDKDGNVLLTGAAMPSCNEGWTMQSTKESDDTYYYLEYRYANILSEEGTTATAPVFSGFQLKSTVTAEDMEGVDMNISIKSQAIQAAGFASADAALAELGTAVSVFETAAD